MVWKRFRDYFLTLKKYAIVQKQTGGHLIEFHLIESVDRIQTPKKLSLDRIIRSSAKK